MSEQDSLKDEKQESRMGTRCHICTGCGRCVSGQEGLQILAAGSNLAEKCNLVSECSPAKEGGEYFIAADIGTTTIAMQLYEPDGRVLDIFATVNPQTHYGADVLSRIQAAENPETAQKLQEMVREVLHQGIERFRSCMEENGVSLRMEENGVPLRMVIAANTTMVYLLMGYDTGELGKAPFHATHLEAIDTEMDGVPCHIFPGYSAFVGGDIAAGVLACGMGESKQLTLLIDLGTNGEMVLGNSEKMLACSTAAGPAFEGGVNRGVWGADMVSLLARLRETGILDETGLLEDPYFEQGVRIGDVLVTQESVRAIQLAKGAIMAGVHILTREYGIAMEQIDRVVLAGGFGYFLDPKAAAAIRLLPEELQEKTQTGGNTALAGALRWERRRLEQQKEQQKVQVINLAECEGFQDLYLDSMNF